MSHIHDYDDVLSAKPMKSRRVFVGGGEALLIVSFHIPRILKRKAPGLGRILIE